MFFRQIRDAALAQYAYLVGCQRTGEALLIDPERDVDRYLELAASEGLRIVAVTETHIHADFLSGARELAHRGVHAYLSGEGGPDWSYRWPEEDGVPFSLLRHGDTFSVGKVEIRVLHTPGHTPEHLSFLITDRGGGADEPMGVLSGDFVFVGDAGRPDLLESAAGVEGAMRQGAVTLRSSLLSFLDLPDYLQLWPGHGAGSACGKALGAVPESTVGYERRFNPAVQAARAGEPQFLDYVLDAQPEPPLYFGRMKRLNRDGPPLLGSLPRPEMISAAALGALAGRLDVAVVDARRDRSAFMRAHLTSALYAPLDSAFPTVTGSFVSPELPIYLVVGEDGLDEALRALVRVGLDRVVGWAAPAALEQLAPDQLSAIEELDIGRLRERSGVPGALPLDVRRLSEFREGHVDGAVIAPHARLLESLERLPRDRELLVYCRTGSRSAVSAALLRRHGFNAVYVNGAIERIDAASPEDALAG
jgi:hydroxyacylglutathione hydrolase